MVGNVWLAPTTPKNKKNVAQFAISPFLFRKKKANGRTKTNWYIKKVVASECCLNSELVYRQTSRNFVESHCSTLWNTLQTPKEPPTELISQTRKMQLFSALSLQSFIILSITTCKYSYISLIIVVLVLFCIVF